MLRLREVMAEGSRSVILFAKGRKFAHGVAMGDTIKLVKIENLRDLRPVTYRDQPYPLKRACRIYLKSGLPKTKAAAKVLRGLLKRGE